MDSIEKIIKQLSLLGIVLIKQDENSYIVTVNGNEIEDFLVIFENDRVSYESSDAYLGGTDRTCCLVFEFICSMLIENYEFTQNWFTGQNCFVRQNN